MKLLISLLFFCILSTFCPAQFKHRVLDEYGNPMNYRISSPRSKIPIFLVADKLTTSLRPFNGIPNDSLGSIVFLEGATSVSVTTRLKKDSLSYYRYSIIENDTAVLVSNALLTKVDFVWPARSDFPGYLTMNVGVADITNKKLTIKIYKSTNESQVTTVIIYNKTVKPAEILEAHLFTESESSTPTNYRGDILLLKNGTKFRINEKTKGIFILMKRTDLDFAYNVSLKHSGSEITSLPANWRYDSRTGDPGYFIDVSYFKRPGEYDIFLSSIYGSQFLKTKPARVSFKVLTSLSTRELLLISLTFLALITVVSAVLINFIRKKSTKKVIAAKQQADAAKSQLNIVRSQLNPHFVFNALGGIQNLINKNEVEKANEYLDKFARLTRNILIDQDLISIKEEISLLEDYLSMEQLRFSFNYEIHADDSLNFSNTEIPAMLVQPFAENAVKHAMSKLKDEGNLLIRFIKEGDNIIVTVADNGRGFDVSKNYDGLGLKLSKKRIALLNQVYIECPVKLELSSGNSNTQVKITLTHWL